MKRALVVGINNYKGNELIGCENDANAIGGLLEENEDGSPNMEVDIKLNVGTRSGLLELVSHLFSGERLLSVFYFSGHGYYTNRGGFLVTPDAKAYDEGIRMDEVIQLANASPAMNRVIILDCCFSGAAAEGNPAGGTMVSIKEGVTVLAASRRNEEAVESGAHGLFTSLLIQAFTGGAADISGHTTPGSVYAYIDKALGEKGQRPVFKTNIVRFISLREVKPQVSPAVLRKLTTYFGEPEESHELNPSYEDTNYPAWQTEKKEPFADAAKVRIFKDLQQLQSVGLVVPENADFMYFAAMNSKSCRLTPLGRHYWNLVKAKKV